MNVLWKGIRFLGTAMTIALVSAVMFCAYQVYYESHTRLYNKILLMHTDPKRTPHNKGQLPFLYVSWFYQNSFYGGEDYALYPSGYSMAHRIISGAVQGGSGPVPDVQTWPVLKQMTALPPGLPGPDAVPANRLLIVSLHHGIQWKTYYYDRHALPPPVLLIARVAEVKGT